LGSQFHPEFLSRPNNPHPLFLQFIKVATELRRDAQHTLPLETVTHYDS
jgi:CTP synthase